MTVWMISTSRTVSLSLWPMPMQTNHRSCRPLTASGGDGGLPWLEVGITVHFLYPEYAEGKYAGEDGDAKDDFFKFPSTPHI